MATTVSNGKRSGTNDKRTSSNGKRSGKKIKAISPGPAGPWHADAPRRLREAYPAIGQPKGWAAWQKHLARRKVAGLAGLFSGKRSPLLWALPELPGDQPATDLVALLANPAAEEKQAALIEAAKSWLSHIDTARASADVGLECLAWCYALPRLAETLDETTWWRLFEKLRAIACESSAGSGESPVSEPLAVQLLAGELPLALAATFPEITTARALAESGCATIEQGMSELLDGEGLLHHKHLPWMRPLLATWTRARALAKRLPAISWSRDCQLQHAGLLEHALRLSRTNGQAVWQRAGSSDWNPSLLKAALRLIDKRSTRKIFRLTQEGDESAQKFKRSASPSFNGEWAGVAVMRPDWRRSSPRLTIGYETPQVQTELSLGSRTLWSGAWELDVRFNGERQTSSDIWEQVCWESDRDADYLELELQVSDQMIVQRHILLAREDRVLILADAVMAIQGGEIDYRGLLPIGGHSVFQGEAETREGVLGVGDRPLARVLPVGLNEWRSAPARGSLRAEAPGLELRHTVEGENLFAPLVIDLDPRRLRREVTWRQLTVGQQRSVVSSDVAVGYRAQVGKQQWLIYRSLTTPAIRTILSKNLMHEFLVGRFLPSGQVETLVEIE